MDKLLAIGIYVGLIILLGSSDFRTREKAQRDLLKIDAAISALEWGTKHTDPEIAARCKALVKEWYQRNADKLTANVLAKVGWKEWPWIKHDHDLDYDTDNFMFNFGYITKARLSGFKYGRKRDWEDLREATRLAVRDMILTNQPYEDWLKKQCDSTLEWYTKMKRSKK